MTRRKEQGETRQDVTSTFILVSSLPREERPRKDGAGTQAPDNMCKSLSITLPFGGSSAAGPEKLRVLDKQWTNVLSDGAGLRWQGERGW